MKIKLEKMEAAYFLLHQPVLYILQNNDNIPVSLEKYSHLFWKKSPFALKSPHFHIKKEYFDEIIAP